MWRGLAGPDFVWYTLGGNDFARSEDTDRASVLDILWLDGEPNVRGNIGECQLKNCHIGCFGLRGKFFSLVKAIKLGFLKSINLYLKFFEIISLSY